MKVCVVTPAGRERYLRILLPYVLRERSWIDEYQLWVNTTNQTDLNHLQRIEQEYSGFVRLVWPSEAPSGRRTVRQFYAGCVDPETVYVKLDDDVCFIAPNALLELVRFRVANPRYFLVFANMINSVLVTYVHQQINAFGREAGLARYDPFCPLSWKSGRFAARVHVAFLAANRTNAVFKYCFDQWHLANHERCSLICCSWLGRDFAPFGGVVASLDDEQWLAVDKPRELRRTSCIFGGSLMVHFAYEPQRDFLERTNLLSEYLRLSRNLVSKT
jgi:hypothetical protein